ncbi:hypothetical protein [Bacillus cereus]|uniref:Uncharacterized protein n=1 Tax=Bacillus cereus TaxID=1396 RepID=A0A0G8EZ19_BACCE|nr:hypothetical protein [Bacillus cereus]KLA29506.1 hypothetical protein B4077_3567 [Bacillus cereus]
MNSQSEKSNLYEVWEKYDSPKTLNQPELILKFLEDIIIATEGRLNTDYYSGGYADNLHSVKKVGKYFYLYWKNFEEYVKQGADLDENKAMDIAIFGNNIFIYQALDIKSLIFLEDENNLYVVINCRYFSKKELIKEITKNYRINKCNIIEVEDSHYIEYIFKDSNNYNHSCQLIPFPISALLIQEKNNPLHESTTQRIMHLVTLDEFRLLLSNWYKEINTLVDYQDERKIKNLGNEIRTETERILKYFILKNTHYGNENFDNLEPIYKDLLNNYGHVQLGDLTKKLAKVNFVVPKDFVITLNTLSHDSGKTPYKKDIELALNNFNRILEKYF